MTTVNFENLEAVIQNIQIIREKLEDEEQKVIFDRIWEVFCELILEALPGLKYTSEMKAATDEEFIIMALMQAIDLKSMPAWCPMKMNPQHYNPTSARPPY